MDKSGVFHVGDVRADKIMEWNIPSTWWSRGYEYPWAFSHARPDTVVADMGCGYEFRPLKNALAEVCKKVYAIDMRPAVLKLQTDAPALEIKVDDFTSDLRWLADASLDTIFCISVLEDVANWRGALRNWKRILKRSGQVVLTFDITYNPNKPQHELYKGLNLTDFWNRAYQIGWMSEGPINVTMPENAVVHTDYNLACYHCILRPE
jgi:SAM-dependent methyltransferase